MTPKEKAEQLIFYYQNLLEPYLKNINTLRNKSIQCALIAVDEMINMTAPYLTLLTLSLIHI